MLDDDFPELTKKAIASIIRLGRFDVGVVPLLCRSYRDNPLDLMAKGRFDKFHLTALFEWLG